MLSEPYALRSKGYGANSLPTPLAIIATTFLSFHPSSKKKNPLVSYFKTKQKKTKQKMKDIRPEPKALSRTSLPSGTFVFVFVFVFFFLFWHFLTMFVPTLLAPQCASLLFRTFIFLFFFGDYRPNS